MKQLGNIPGQTSEAGRVRPWSILFGLVVIIAGFTVATQRIASGLAYQPALGSPLTTMGDTPIYLPINWLVWYIKFGNVQHEAVRTAFQHGLFIVGASLVLGIGAAIVFRYFSTRDLQKSHDTLHGSAHFMPPEKVLTCGLVNTGRGVYIGAWRNPKTGDTHYLRHDGPEHVLAYAPTRSGKGVGLVIPTLLSWPHSSVTYDVKGEAYALTSGWRKSIGHKVLRFAPTDPTGAGVSFNPLDEVRLGTLYEVSDAQNQANMIVDPDGKGLNDHWAKTGHALLVGAILHVLYSEREKTLPGVANFLSDPSRDIEETFKLMLTTSHDVDFSRGWLDSNGEPTRTHPTIAMSARDMLNKAPNEASGVLSTAMSFLTLYRDPIVASNTSKSEFRISDLMNHDTPVSLYIVVPPADKDRLKPLVRLLITMIVRGLANDMGFEGGRAVANYKHRLLLMMDEFPSLGKLDIFEEALAFIAGYGIKAYIIIQDLKQLRRYYGQDETITSNTHIRSAYAPNTLETAKALSETLGKQTVVKQTVGYSGKRANPTMDSISTNVTEVSRDLMTPDEVMRLKAPVKDVKGDIVEAGDMLVMAAGQAPIFATQILYFQDPTFSARSRIIAPSVSDRIRQPAVVAVAPASAALTAPPAATHYEGEDRGAPIEWSEDAEEDSPPLPDSAMVDYGPEDSNSEAFDDDHELGLGEPIVFGEDESIAESEQEPDHEQANGNPEPSEDPFEDAITGVAAVLHGSTASVKTPVLDPLLARAQEISGRTQLGIFSSALEGAAPEEAPVKPGNGQADGLKDILSKLNKPKASA
jgi:type IV secretion system protein VirD4